MSNPDFSIWSISNSFAFEAPITQAHREAFKFFFCLGHEKKGRAVRPSYKKKIVEADRIILNSRYRLQSPRRLATLHKAFVKGGKRVHYPRKH